MQESQFREERQENANNQIGDTFFLIMYQHLLLKKGCFRLKKPPFSQNNVVTLNYTGL